MPSRHTYLQGEVPVSVDPLRAVHRLVGAGVLGDAYAVFEKDGCYQVSGAPAGEVRVEAARVRGMYDGRVIADSPVTDAVSGAREVLRNLPLEGWQACGWASFELGLSIAGLRTGDQPLIHLMVPRVEVRLGSDGTAVVRSLAEEDLDLVAKLLGTASDTEAERVERQWRPRAAPVDNDGGWAYEAGVRLVVDDIRAGRLKKAILSRTVPVGFPLDLAATYVHGRRNNTPARSFLLSLGGVEAAGFSPETVVEVTGRTVTTQPLAGTRAMADDPAETARLREELYASPKEVAEHAISVRTSVEELERVSLPGSVRVGEFMTTKERGSVQHLASTVTGTLADGRDAWDALAATFPAVTASGIPKRAAYDCIRRLENGPRGLYAGAVLTAGDDGSMDAALVLRTVFRARGRTWLQAGAGIVENSEPRREYEETCEKLRSVSRFLVPESGAARLAQSGRAS